MPEITGTCC